MRSKPPGRLLNKRAAIEINKVYVASITPMKATNRLELLTLIKRKSTGLLMH